MFDMEPISPNSNYNFTLLSAKDGKAIAQFFSCEELAPYKLGIEVIQRGEVVAFTCPAEIVQEAKLRKALCIQWATDFEDL